MFTRLSIRIWLLQINIWLHYLLLEVRLFREICSNQEQSFSISIKGRIQLRRITAMTFKHVKLMMMVTMTLICLYILAKVLHIELSNQTWLPRSQVYSAMRASKELSNPKFVEWPPHLPDIRPTKQMQNGLVTPFKKTCNEHKLDKNIIQQLKYNPSSPIVVPKYKLIFFGAQSQHVLIGKG